MMPPVAILAGGLATRLRPLTEKVPKSLLTFNGKAFIAYQLEKLKENNVKKVVICIGYLGSMIKEYMATHQFSDLEIIFSDEWPDILGTGGAIKKALPNLEDEFMIIYGDSFLDVNYQELYKKFKISGKPALLTVLKNSNGYEKSNVHFKQDMILKYDKKNDDKNLMYIDYGLSFFRKEIFDIPDDKFDLAYIQEKLSCDGLLAGAEVQIPYQEIGSINGIRNFEKYLKAKRLQ